jgi:hypothetical protein
MSCARTSRWLCTLSLAACASQPAPLAQPRALCQIELPTRTSQLRAGDWVRLLLQTERRGDALYAHSSCTGERIEHLPLPSDCEVQAPDPGVAQPLPLTEASVVERVLPENRRLVWIMTHRFPNGDGFGPVATASIDDHSASIGTVGLLRMRPLRVDLELWGIGDTSVLMAAGESCDDPQKPSSCRRGANLLVFAQSRFHAAPIRRTQSRECIDAPWVEFKREADLTLDNGWNRHMRIVTTLDHDQRYVVITERVDVADTDPNRPDVPPRDVRRIDTERFIHVEGANLYTRQSPLWPRIIPSQGKTKVATPASPMAPAPAEPGQAL